MRFGVGFGLGVTIGGLGLTVNDGGSVSVIEDSAFVLGQHPDGEERDKDDHGVETDPFLVGVQPKNSIQNMY